MFDLLFPEITELEFLDLTRSISFPSVVFREFSLCVFFNTLMFRVVLRPMWTVQVVLEYNFPHISCWPVATCLFCCALFAVINALLHCLRIRFRKCCLRDMHKVLADKAQWNVFFFFIICLLWPHTTSPKVFALECLATASQEFLVLSLFLLSPPFLAILLDKLLSMVSVNGRDNWFSIKDQRFVVHFTFFSYRAVNVKLGCYEVNCKIRVNWHL